MIFVIGGKNQGKLDYALSLTKFKNEDVLDCMNIDRSNIDKIISTSRTVIYNFDNLIKELLRLYDDEESVKSRINEMIQNGSISVIVSNEIGYGIVPIDKFERRYRELTGRICCEIAQKSKEVHRVICGIGTVIKGKRYD